MQLHNPLNPATGVEDPTQLPWTNGFPQTGQNGSFPPYQAVVEPMTELANLIALAGLTGTSADLNQVTRAVRGGQLDFDATDTGTADAVLCQIGLPHTQLATGLPFTFLKGPNSNTGNAVPTLTLTDLSGNNSLTGTIVKSGGGALAKGDLPANALITLRARAPGVFAVVSMVLISDVLSLIAANAKTRLSGATTFYVNSQTGSDSNPGTQAAPFLTIQAAVNYAQKNLDLNGYTLTFSCAGSFTAGVTVPGLFSGQTGPASVVFAMGSSAMTSVGSCFTAANGAGFSITGTGTYSSTGTNAAAGQGWIINAANNSAVVYSGIVFGSAVQSHIVSTQDSTVTASGNYSISGGATAHFYSQNYSTVVATGVTVTITGNPAFSTGFAYANYSFIGASGMTFSGSATGVRSYQDIGGYIYINSASATYFPGNAASVTVPFTVGQGGTGYGGGTLPTYSPTFTPTSNASGFSVTLNNAEYLQIGKMLFVRVAFQPVYTNAPGAIIFTLPNNLNSFGTNAFPGFNLSGLFAISAYTSGNGNVTVSNANGGSPCSGSSQFLVVEGWIEVQ